MFNIVSCTNCWSAKHWHDTSYWAIAGYLQNILNLSEIELMPVSDIIFLGNHILNKLFCMVVLGYMLIGLLSCDDKELTVIIYNTKVGFIV